MTQDTELLAAEYVLGTLEADARERFARELAGDASLQALVADWERRLSTLDEAVPPVEPRQELWQAIEAGLDDGLPGTVTLRAAEGHARAPGDGGTMRTWLAALALFASGCGGTAYQYAGYNTYEYFPLDGERYWKYVNDDTNSCDDGDVCNGDETCNAGVCDPGTPLTCDDSNPCTDDSCDEDNDVIVNAPDERILHLLCALRDRTQLLVVRIELSLAD